MLNYAEERAANIVLRHGRPDDAKACGKICYEAFAAISATHNFPRDFPSPDIAIQFTEWALNHSGFYSVVAEEDGRIVGSNFVDTRNAIAGIGPVTVEPSEQNKAVGRQLMCDAHAYVARQAFPGVRLVQAAYHNRSLSLYAKLGYDVREPLACMQGKPVNKMIDGCEVRAATEADLEACNELCKKVHGFDRGGELRDAIANTTAQIVLREGRITGYATMIGFFGHVVCEENSDVKALIGAATAFAGPGLLLPMRNGELFRWCLQQGLQVVQPMTLMSRGLYNEPAGAFLPSVLF